jgi:hypothetical protein
VLRRATDEGCEIDRATMIVGEFEIVPGGGPDDLPAEVSEANGNLWIRG